MKNKLTDFEIELTRFSCMAELRRAQRRQLVVVCLVLLGVALAVWAIGCRLLSH